MDSLTRTGRNVLHLDLGNFASTEDHIGESRTRFLWKEMGAMRVTATTPGAYELSLWPVYQSLLDTGEVAVVSSNLTFGKGGEPVGQRTLVLDVGGVRVGLFGLISASEFVNARLPEGVVLEFLDPFEVARQVVPELSQEAEIVVLLSQMTPTETDRLLDGVPGIDVALYGNRAPFVESAGRVKDTITNKTSIRGQYLGSLSLIVDPAGQIVDYGSRNAPLDMVWPEIPEVRARCLALQEEEQKTLALARERARQAAETAQATSIRYLGAEVCARCHQAEYEHWRTTPHAEAFATLNGGHGMEMNAECVSCHVTGYGQANGYVEGSTRPDLRNVQCEACHGPGTEHVRRGGAVKLTAAACTGCHTGEFAKDFEFGTFYELVKHTP